jgi:hypothetical protein
MTICTNQNTISKLPAHSAVLQVTVRPSVSIFMILMLCQSMDVPSLRHLQQRSQGLCTRNTTKQQLLSFPQPARHGYSEHFETVLAKFPKFEADIILSHLPFSKYATIAKAQRILVRNETLHATTSFHAGNDSTDYRFYIQQ